MRQSSLREEVKARMEEMAGRAERELDLRRVFGEEYFDGRGVWRFDVKGEEDGSVGFREVARGHPLVGRWIWELGEVVRLCGLELRVEDLVGDGTDELQV